MSVVCRRDLLVVARRRVIIAGLLSAWIAAGVSPSARLLVLSTGTSVAMPRVAAAFDGTVHLLLIQQNPFKIKSNFMLLYLA